MKINVKRSPSTWVLYPIPYIIWIPNVANHLKKASQKNELKKKSTKQNKSPPICSSTSCDSEAVVIQGSNEDPCFCIGSGLPSRHCSPFFCCSLGVLEPTAFQSASLNRAGSPHTLKTQVGKSSYHSLLKSRIAALLGKICSLSSGTRKIQEGLPEERLSKKVWHEVDFKCHLSTIIIMEYFHREGWNQ